MSHHYEGYVLPNDRSRCHNDECSQSKTCLRRIQWGLSKAANHTTYSENMFEEAEGGGCAHYIQVEEGDEGYEGLN